MTKPLAMLFFEKLLPGSQVANRLEDLGYRVLTVSQPGVLVSEAQSSMPMLVIADVEPRHQTVCHVLADLRKNEATSHIPVIAVAAEHHAQAQEAAREAGASLVVTDHAILLHLPQLLDQALQV